MGKKFYTCTQSFGRDALSVRTSADGEVIFRAGNKRDGTVRGLDVYVSAADLPALIAQLQEELVVEAEPIEYEEAFECEYDSGVSLLIEHTKHGILPEVSIQDGYGDEGESVYLPKQALLDLRDLIDLSLEKIEANSD